MRKILIFFSSIFLLTCCSLRLSSDSDFSKATIEKFRKEGFSKSEINVLSKARRALKKEVSFEKLFSSDVVFTLEYYQYENGTVYGRIWSKKDTMRYSYNNYKMYFGKRLILNPIEGVCCENIFDLVSDWKVNEIKSKKTFYPEQIAYISKTYGTQEKVVLVDKIKLF